METNQTNVQEFILSDSGQQFIIEETISVDEPQTWIITTDVLPSEAHEEILSPVTTSSSSPSVTTTHYRPIVMKVPEPPPEPIPVSEHYKQVLQEQIPTCYAEVATASLSQLRQKGSSFLRAHASRHGITNASRKLTSQVLTELTRHYALAHLVKVVEDDSNMSKSKRKNPVSPSSTVEGAPSNRKIPHIQVEGTCKMNVLAKTLLELSACGTSLLRPEAALHRVHNASRKSKDVVVSELWEHYVHFHNDQLSQPSSPSDKKSTKV
ncbi:uncharacterized protein [Lepeophtheirus salmonis]|uniref:uncharacterized protein isoform X1 n=1 Tax=Lepeophtheirus salmonis TaxID=72036 RepID=UPI001AE363F4|nr:uncharacterized protein LOC121127291 isoform X1 [Lepeophtheirus salmonis]